MHGFVAVERFMQMNGRPAVHSASRRAIDGPPGRRCLQRPVDERTSFVVSGILTGLKVLTIAPIFLQECSFAAVKGSERGCVCAVRHT